MTAEQENGQQLHQISDVEDLDPDAVLISQTAKKISKVEKSTNQQPDQEQTEAAENVENSQKSN